MINVEESNDFIINSYDKNDENDIFVVSHEDREFSNILLIGNNTVTHHIYMHNKECFDLDSFIKHINSTLKSISFYHENVRIKIDLIQKEYELHTSPLCMNV